MARKKIKLESKRKINVSVYMSKEEKNKIDLLAVRISKKGKTKPIAQIIRHTILSVAENPDLDFIYDSGNILNLSSEEIKVRQLLYQHILKNIDLLKDQGIIFPNLNEEEDNGYKYEINQKNT